MISFASSFSNRRFAFLVFFLNLQEAAKLSNQFPQLHRVLFFGDPPAKFLEMFAVSGHFSFSRQGPYSTSVQTSLLENVLSSL